eukprot:2330621-Ditylum_brightwellii.AAC.1
MTEPSENPTYNPTATDVEITPRKPAQEQEGDNKEEHEENVLEEDVDPEPPESQDENNNKDTETIEQELIQEINNFIAPTTSLDIGPPSTPT